MIYEPKHRLLIYLMADFSEVASIKYCDRCPIGMKKDFPLMPDCIFPIYEGIIVYEFLDCGISRTIFQGLSNVKEIWFSGATANDFEAFLWAIARKNLVDENCFVDEAVISDIPGHAMSSKWIPNGQLPHWMG